MRDFSDSIKFSIVRGNLEKNNGRICCEVCGKELRSINEAHFDHIEAFARGGKSTRSNCQILCSDCNLKKNDKELADFILDEKARKFLEGSISQDAIINKKENANLENINKNLEEITKEKFDLLISDFINKKGNINKVDFNRVYNNLPSIKYVYKYYGDFSSFKQSFNLKEPVIWNRETIKEALENYIKIKGDVLEKDLKSRNGLPSYPCIIKYYPEYRGLNELKKSMFNLKVRTSWTKEKVLKAGKDFVQKNGKITQKDLVLKNNLPTSRLIYKYFDTMENFQKLVGSDISKRNELITIEDFDRVIESVFESRNRNFDTRKEFLDFFPISSSVIYKNFDSFDLFCEKYKIIIKKRKKAKFTKQEIDNIILNYIKEGNDIPKTAKELVKLGLPSRDVIVRYYQDWHEPFIFYSKLYERIN